MLPEKVLYTEKKFVKSSCKIRLQITKFWARHDFATRSCCDLGLQGSNQYVARDTLSQYGDHSCEIVVIFDFKSSYGLKIILLKGYTVTLTFKIASKMLCATRRLNMVIIYVK